MKTIVILLSLFVSLKGFSQNSDPAKAKYKPVAVSSDTSATFMKVEKMPEFPGGDEGLMEYLSKNIQYPDSSRNKNIQGKVILSFIINKKGEITNIKTLQGVSPDIDKEAIRVVSQMPRWKPGKQDGKDVNVQFTLPLRFSLNGNEKK